METPQKIQTFDDWDKLEDCKDYLDSIDGEVKEIFLLMNKQSLEAEERIRVITISFSKSDVFSCGIGVRGRYSRASGQTRSY